MLQVFTICEAIFLGLKAQFIFKRSARDISTMATKQANLINPNAGNKKFANIFKLEVFLV